MATILEVEARLSGVPSFARQVYRNADPVLFAAWPRIVAWGECIAYATAADGPAEAACEVEYIRLIERRRDDHSVRTVLGATDFRRDPGRTFRREEAGEACWYDYCPSGNRGDSGEGALTTFVISAGGAIRYDMTSMRTRVVHFWTLSDTPDTRAAARDDPAIEYVLEVRFATNGQAALRVGQDVRPANPDAQIACPRTGEVSSVCEAMTSAWYSTATPSMQTMTVPVG